MTKKYVYTKFPRSRCADCLIILLPTEICLTIFIMIEYSRKVVYNRLYLWLIYIHAIQNKVGKTKSKFKEVLQMSYLKPSCNCKFCQLWEKVFLFIIASTNPTVNLNDALFTVPSRDVPRQHFTKTKISSKKKTSPKTFSIQDRKNI